jgi:hypothetical protein
MVAVGEGAPQAVDGERRVALLRGVPALATLPAALLQYLAAVLGEERHAAPLRQRTSAHGEVKR